MTDQVIPAEAVEAAAKAWLAAGLFDDQMRAALEAAAPYLTQDARAEAWDEGYEAADADARFSLPPDNPYRKDPK